MWKLTPIFFAAFLLLSCSGENKPHEERDSVEDSIHTVAVPTFDISGPYEVKLNDRLVEIVSVNGEPTVELKNISDKDTLFIHYSANTPCEECRLETQLWVAGKYTELVRDTGYGVGPATKIPCSLLIQTGKPGTAEYSNIALFLSVRQYHPVETGNKRFLFYIELK